MIIDERLSTYIDSISWNIPEYLKEVEKEAVKDGVPIAIILQYGHATGTGGWVEGRDYINPAIQPIFDKIAENAWREVTKL